MLEKRKILKLYKEIIIRTLHLPQHQAGEALAKTRKLFRENRLVPLTPTLLKQVEDRVAFLKMVTPRTHSDVLRETANAEKKMKETFIISKNGEVISGKGVQDVQGFRDKRDDTEAFMKRHQQLLRRQHFMDRS
jgi:hypothetical protein